MILKRRFPGRTATVRRLQRFLCTMTPDRASAPLYPSVTNNEQQPGYTAEQIALAFATVELNRRAPT